MMERYNLKVLNYIYDKLSCQEKDHFETYIPFGDDYQLKYAETLGELLHSVIFDVVNKKEKEYPPFILISKHIITISLQPDRMVHIENDIPALSNAETMEEIEIEMMLGGY